MSDTKFLMTAIYCFFLFSPSSFYCGHCSRSASSAGTCLFLLTSHNLFSIQFVYQLFKYVVMCMWFFSMAGSRHQILRDVLTVVHTVICWGNAQDLATDMQSVMLADYMAQNVISLLVLVSKLGITRNLLGRLMMISNLEFLELKQKNPWVLG